MKRTTFVCDRCGQEAESKMMPEGWTAADIRFNNLPKMGMDGGVIFLDLCEPCQDELKRVWDEWLNPPTLGEITERAAERKAAAERHRQFERESYERVIAERKQAEIDRRKERIADIAKDRGQHEPRGRFPAEREPGEDYEASAVERLQWWARSTAK
jgi:hypothetical protein